MESVIAQSHEGLNRYKEERDKLHGERKYVTPLLSSFFFSFLNFYVDFLLDERRNIVTVKNAYTESIGWGAPLSKSRKEKHSKLQKYIIYYFS